MKLKAFARIGLGTALMLLAAEGAWAQASSGTMPPKVVPPHSLSVPSQSSGLSDSVITAHAKIALLGAKGTDAGDIHVTTNGGVVMLTGHVASATEKQKAEQVVRGLDGVTEVQNALSVQGSSK
jgi:hyperosmotically inducible protein